MRNYIILNGKNSNEINGLLIQELPPISKPLIRTEVEEIDGRDGDIVTPLGYSAYDKELTIGLYKDFDVNEVAAYFNSEGTVIFSNEPDKYYYYQITAQIDFERLVRYRTATVTMHCQPFKYSATEQPITEDVSGTVSDEGTNLALENTAEAPFNTLDLKGNTSQQTYSGKNLLKLTPQASTSNGITATLTDGVIKYSGTASTNWANIAARTYNSIPAGDYMLSMQETFTTNYAYALSVTYTDNTTATFECWKSVGNKRTVTLAKDVASYYVYLTGLTSGTSYSGTISLMLESGSTATTPFEPYTNGPAPNPDYPQAVQTVTGENVVKICKKNLFDVSAIPYVAKRAYGADGTELIWNNYSGIDGYQQVAPNTTYTITKGASGSVSYLCEYDKNKAFIQRKTDQRTFTTTANTHYLRWSVYSQGDVAPTQTQLELGSTATAYEPYQGQSYEVNLGKNLFDVNSITEKTQATTSGVEDHEVTYSASNYRAIMLIKVEPNSKYTLSIGDTNIVSRIYCVGMKNTTLESGHSFSWVNSGSTITTASKDNYILGVLNISSGQGTIANVTNANVQFEKGSQATTYAAYFEPIELCQIGDYIDKPFKNVPESEYYNSTLTEGAWYVRKVVGKITLDGSESWTYWNATGDVKRYYTTSYSSLVQGLPTSTSAVSDHYRFAGVTSSTNTAGMFFFNLSSGATSANGNVSVAMTGLDSTADAIKTWLAENNTALYYALATPTDTEITNEALIEQLNDIYYHAHAYKGRTHITSSAATGNVPHIIAAEVGEDNESTITNAGNYLSKPKITVYGSGDISLYINDMHVLQITLGDEGYITIDTAQMEAYKDTLDNLKNRLVIGDYSNARLKPGANKIHFTGTVTKYVVENYSRWL